jgi:CheY-like chemotaxis protein
MSWPLMQRPGSVCFLDDDASFLETLLLTLPQDWHVQAFCRPRTCIYHLQQQPPLVEADNWAQRQAQRAGLESGRTLLHVLRYWQTHPDRFAHTNVAVFDQVMPGMTGLQVFSELFSLDALRVLLTGQADEHLAIRAFNDGSIEQFITKQSSGLSKLVSDAVTRLQSMGKSSWNSIWQAGLNRAQLQLLQHPTVQRALRAWLHQAGWVEWVTLGQPYGLLGMDALGKTSWLQLETEQSLPGLIEMCEQAGIPAKRLDALRTRTALSDLELWPALGHEHEPRNQALAFSVADLGVYAAAYPLPEVFHLPLHARQTWLSAHADRSVRD